MTKGGEYFHEMFNRHHSNLTLNTLYILHFYDLWWKYANIIVFIINHKNTIYIMYLVRSLWWRTNVSWKYSPPLSCSPRGVFANLRVTFKLLLFDFDRTSVMGDFFQFQMQIMHVFNFWIGTILQLENTCMLALLFWIWRIESSCHGNTIILRILLKLKNPPQISLLITKLSISQTYIC
jgi:hypothetical protein